MEFVRVKKGFDVDKFINLRDELLDNVYSLFYEIVNSYDNSTVYSVKLYQIFFDFHKNFKTDFEFNLDDFYKFRQLNFTKDDWIVIYKIFKDVLIYCNDNPSLTTFTKLFYADVILIGPFSEDFRCLDMNFDFLELMTEEVKKLFWLFDEYFNNRDKELIKDIKSVCMNDSIPYCMAYHLAWWINDHEKEDKIVLDLYVIAINKIYKRPIFYQRNLDDVSEIRVELDTSYHFSDEIIDEAFSKIKDWR
jgi:hypothetical protein